MFCKRQVAVAFGLFSIGLVLGWAALFKRGETPSARLVQLAWFAGLILLVAVAPDPRAAAAGAIGGFLAHFIFLSGLGERSA